jgi:adenine-specific DNA glycosylase
VREGCKALRLGIADRLPERRAKSAPVRVRVAAAVLLDGAGRTLLVRAPTNAAAGDDRPAELGPIFSRLWHFPAVVTSGDSRTDLESHLSAELSLDGAGRWQAIPAIRHAVTFRDVTIEPWLIHVEELPRGAGKIVALDAAGRMAISSASRKIAAAALAKIGEA